MNNTSMRTWSAALGVVAAAVALLAGGYLLGTRHTAQGAPNSSAAPTDQPARKVLYWHDPMVPQQHFDKAGKSPFMDMQLVPVYADGDGGDGEAGHGVKIDATMAQNLGLRLASVRRQQVSTGFDAVGSTQWDESQSDVIQSRVAGYIDRLYTSAPMQRVTRGAPVASLFVPDWLAVQQEYLALKRSQMNMGHGLDLLDAARERMRAMSIPPGLIAQLDRTGQAQTHLTLTAPRTGVLSELNVRNGAMVTPGQTLAKVAGTGKLWLIVDIPEAQALQVRPGMRIQASPAGDASTVLQGHLREILPGIDTTSRTLQARLEIGNPNGVLTPGMLMRVHVASTEQATRLVIPSEAVIATGKRSIVIVKNAQGRLQPVQVRTGQELGSDTEVLEGLNEGDTVVASGQFLVDSEASLRSVLARMLPEAGASKEMQGMQGMQGMQKMDKPAGPPAATAAAQTYSTTGRVEQVTPGEIIFSHQPIAALKWPAMTMGFAKPSANAFAGVAAGQTVQFSFRQTPAGYELTDVKPATGAGQ